MENYDNAITDLQEAVRMKPSSIKYRSYLSDILANCGRLEDAKNGTNESNECICAIRSSKGV